MTRSRITILGAAAALAAVLWAWYAWWPGDERAIRRRLDALAAAVNQEAAEGLGAVGRAAEIGSFFTHDVVVSLGQGAPIHGREALIGMAARLPTGAAGYSLEFDDVSVAVTPGASEADVSAAAILTGAGSGGERSTEAREVTMGMAKQDGAWRIARVTVVDTLRRE